MPVSRRKDKEGVSATDFGFVGETGRGATADARSLPAARADRTGLRHEIGGRHSAHGCRYAWVDLGMSASYASGSLGKEPHVYARTVTASFDVNLVAELIGFGESVKEQVASFPGLQEWRFVANVETGRAVSFSTFDDEAAFLESKAEIDSILSALGRFLVDTPVEILGEVVFAA